MKVLLVLLSLTCVAQADNCQTVYDAMNNKYVLVCKPTPEPPKCHEVYDAMNNKYVLVCDGVVQR